MLGQMLTSLRNKDRIKLDYLTGSFFAVSIKGLNCPFLQHHQQFFSISTPIAGKNMFNLMRVTFPRFSYKTLNTKNLKWRHATLSLMIFAFSWSTSGCSAAGGKVEDVYQNLCASCHGNNMQGGLGPSLVDAQWVYGSSNEEIANIIKNGAGEGGMPAFSKSLSDQEIRGLVIFMREMAYQTPQAPQELTPDLIFNAAGHAFSLQKIASIRGKIWSMAFTPDNKIIATELAGKLWVIDKGKVVGPVEGTPKVSFKNQGGLLEVALHPDYAKNGWIYLSLSDPVDDVTMTKVVRGKIEQGKWLEQQTIFEAPKRFYTDRSWHYGSRLAFINDDLYITVGDRTEKELAQDTASPNGKILRIKDDGTIPNDNPIFDSKANSKNNFPGVWSYGHRNQQGLAVDPVTGDLWSSEHGPRGGDELNLISKGLNYGWPVITYGMDYDGTPLSDTVKTHQEGMEQPKHYWVPSIAVSDIDFYTGPVFPKWRNQLLVGSLAKQELRLVTINNQAVTGDQVLLKNYGRVRDVADGPDGHPYIVLNNDSEGSIYRLVPAEEAVKAMDKSQ
jgi:glucose/arabinose dehydrogenase